MKRILLVIAVLAWAGVANAQTAFTATADAAWEATSTWSKSGGASSIPGDNAGDTITTLGSHVVSVSANHTLKNITAGGTGYIASAGTCTLTLTGSATCNSASSSGMFQVSAGVLTIAGTGQPVLMYLTTAVPGVYTTGSGSAIITNSAGLALYSTSTAKGFYQNSTGTESAIIGSTTSTGTATTTSSASGATYCNGQGYGSYTINGLLNITGAIANSTTNGVSLYCGTGGSCQWGTDSAGTVTIPAGAECYINYADGHLILSNLVINNSGTFALIRGGVADALTQTGTVSIVNKTSTAQAAGIKCALSITNYGEVVNFADGSVTGGTLNISSGSTGYTSGGTLNVPAASSVLTTAALGFSSSGTYNVTNLAPATVKSGVTFGVALGQTGIYAGHGPLSAPGPKPKKTPVSEQGVLPDRPRLKITIEDER